MLANSEDKTDFLIEQGYYHDENFIFYQNGRAYDFGESGEDMEPLYDRILEEYEEKNFLLTRETPQDRENEEYNLSKEEIWVWETFKGPLSLTSSTEEIVKFYKFIMHGK